MSFSRLKDSGCCGSTMTRGSRAGSSMPSSRSNSQDRLCCAISRRCSRLASRDDDRREILELLVEIGAQPLQLLGVAQILGGDDLVELGGEGLVVGAALIGRARRGGGRRGSAASSESEKSASSSNSPVGASADSIVAVVHRLGRGLGFFHLRAPRRLGPPRLRRLRLSASPSSTSSVAALLVFRIALEARLVDHFERRRAAYAPTCAKAR